MDDKYLFCTSCGKQLEPGAMYCPACGSATSGGPLETARPNNANSGKSRTYLLVGAAFLAITAAILLYSGYELIVNAHVAARDVISILNDNGMSLADFNITEQELRNAIETMGYVPFAIGVIGVFGAILSATGNALTLTLIIAILVTIAGILTIFGLFTGIIATYAIWVGKKDHPSRA